MGYQDLKGKELIIEFLLRNISIVPIIAIIVMAICIYAITNKKRRCSITLEAKIIDIKYIGSKCRINYEFDYKGEVFKTEGMMSKYRDKSCIGQWQTIKINPYNPNKIYDIEGYDFTTIALISVVVVITIIICLIAGAIKLMTLA